MKLPSLSDLKQHLNPKTIIQNAFKQMLPIIAEQLPPAVPQIEAQLLAHFEKIEKPAIEGGLLQPDQEMIVYVLSKVEDKIVMAQCPARFENEQFILSTPLFTLGIPEFATIVVENMKNINSETSDHE